ncbi:MAG: YegP family protein [Anaerolineae bacterium]
MAGKFEIKDAKKGQVYFVLKAGNGKVILTGEPYTNKSGCTNGIASVRKNSQMDDRFERLTGKKGAPYFVLKAANKKVIGTSEMYSTTSAMENGIASVKTNAPTAEVKDLTKK